MRGRNSFLLLCTLLFTFLGYSQQKDLPNTFLWRISGNGLSKPSFLYGTIHLTDRKLFYFGDSLYHYLSQAEAFHIEVDPDSMVAVTLKKYMQADNSPLIKKVMDKKSYETYSARLSKLLKKPADRITARDVYNARNSKMAQEYKKGDMAMFMDMYLYNIAKKQGKKTGGIEDVADQVNVLDEVFSSLDLEFLVTDSLQRENNAMLKKMKEIYINQDLAGLFQMINNNGDEHFKDSVLTKRNVKMTYRMGNLSHERSSFFAVGAAHLPGDSGVIQLLQQSGFTVEPVFSTKKIDPKNYTYKEVEVLWPTYNHENQLYKVDMPGAPQPMEAYKEVMDMQYYVDISAKRGFFTAIANSAAPDNKRDSVLNDGIERMGGEGKIISKKAVVHDGNNGYDVLIRQSGGEYIRLNVFVTNGWLYLAMITATSQELVNDNDSKRFFKSFVMTPKALTAKKFIHYTDSTQAFSVDFPETPSVKKTVDFNTGNGEETQFAANDFATGYYYGVYVTNQKPGTYIPNDSNFIQTVKQTLIGRLKSDTTTKSDLFNGLPALYMNGSSNINDFYCHILTVLRGNRAYVLIVVNKDKKEHDPKVDSFFHSFKLTGYKQGTWTQFVAPDQSFKAWLPSLIINKNEDDAVTDEEIDDTTLVADTSAINTIRASNEYLAYDEATAASFNIERQTFNAYYSAKNDSLLFASTISSYKSEGDSLVLFNRYQLNNDKVAEAMLTNPKSSFVKKLRLILHGDTMYHLYAYLPEWLVNTSNTQKMFADFVITSTAPATTLLTNKISQFVADLSSADSTVFEKAAYCLYEPQLTTEDLPALHPLLLKPLRDFDDNKYINTYGRLTDAIADVADSSTVHFVAEQYSKLTGSQQKLQYPLLKLLVMMKQPYADEIAKKLFDAAVPGGDATTFTSALYNKQAFTKSIFPSIMEYTKDTTSAMAYAFTISHLLDSNYITKTEVLPYLPNFVAAAAQQRKRINAKSDDYDYDLYNILDIFGTINNSECQAQLQSFSQVKDMGLKFSATSWLVKNNQPVAAETIQKLAASDEYRVSIYDALKAVNKLNLFPTAYLSQKMFASAYIYSYASDEDDIPQSIQFVAEKTAVFKGTKSRFFLFKITYGKGKEATHSLGVAGPFDQNVKNVTTENDATGMYYKADFSNAAVSKQFADYLKELEDEEEEE